MPQIKRLTPILANQIAAGEVVERPASVVKELVENSIDAGSTQIEISIEKGGHKRILVRDNGCGIEKDQLTLALSRHATSKIETLDDLENIASLGFRGEAMASISSVARLTLTSNTEAQNQGWQAFAEGSEMNVKISPSAHPIGTSVLVEDLFFNTPARRKFLKTEKTEFSHIESLITRISLANSKVSFTLNHNGKRIKHFASAGTEQEQLKRIQEACGAKFVKGAHQLNSEYQHINLTGWINLESHLGAPVEHQYFYVNGRVVKDKLLQHALRQACTELMPSGVSLNYVLFLALPADQVDVNVHPAKHEVRFHQARMMHDFIVRSLTDVLSEVDERASVPPAFLKSAAQSHDYISAPRPAHESSSSAISEPARGVYQSQYTPAARPSSAALHNYKQLLTPTEPDQTTSKWNWLAIDEKYLLIAFEQNHWVIKANCLVAPYLKQQFVQGLVSQPLLMPIAVPITSSHHLNMTLMDAFKPLGFDLSLTKTKLIIKAVPSGLREFNWATVWQQLINTNGLIDNANALDILLEYIETSDITIAPFLITSSFQWLTQLNQPTALSLLDAQANPINLARVLEHYLE